MIKWLREHHWVHTWTKWELLHPLYLTFQKRTCDVCGKIEVKYQ